MGEWSNARSRGLVLATEPAQLLLASIVRSAHDAIMSMSLDGIITSWNPSSEWLFGYPADEVLGGVLVVEDEPAIREVIRRILQRNGYHVLMTETPLDALDTAGTHEGQIHLLLTDVVMPKTLGKDVAERVRALRPAVKVLYMSGYARPVLANTGTLEPGVTLLEKPFSEAVLLSAVRQVLDG